jgi:hypothetical protein
MKSIVELIDELKGLDDIGFAERFKLVSLDQAHSRKLDFDNWLRRNVPPRQQFVDMKEAWNRYEKSFG